MPGSINCIDNKTTDSSFFVEDTDNAATTSNLDMRKSRSGGVINSGDTIGNVRFMGFDGAAYQVGARIFGITNGTIAAGRMPTDLFFSTAPDSVSSDLLRMTIASTGEVTIAAPDSGIGLTIAGGGEQITAGNLSLLAGNILLTDTNALGTTGIIEFGGNRWIHNFGTSNTFVGEFAGSLAITFGADNVAVGTDALSVVTGGSGNVAVGSEAGKDLLGADASVLIGFQAGENITSGPNNTAVGYQALQACVTNINNVALGYQTLQDCTSDNNVGLGIQSLTNLTTGARNIGVGAAPLPNLLTGDDNIAIGYQAAQNYTGAESDNIIIGNSGVLADGNTIRIGTQGSGSGQQDTCYIAGITGVSVSNLALVSIDTTTGQLGSTTGGSSFLNALDGDTGTATPSGGVITIAGGNGITTAAAASTVTIDLDAPVSIANGGTNAISFATTDGTVYYDGTRLVTTTTGSAGDVLTSNGVGMAPTYQTPTTGATQFDADSGSATPTAGVINVFGAGTVTTSASGNTITITGSGGSGFTWTVVTGATQAMAVNNGYIANNGGTCVMTLPSTAAVGDVVRVTGINNDTGWQIAQNSGQTIYFGDSNTTTGVTGFLASSLTRDSVELVCVVADDDWNVLSCQGNIEVN